jgi:uncharacterized protein YqgV (UPF0045/DUF77 family)
MIVESQVLPTPSGTPERRWANVSAAIDVIQQSGLSYEVGALGTSIEGEPDAVWDLVRRVHEAALAAAQTVITILKVVQIADPAADITINDLVGQYRTST